jgi:type IV secretory pathway VirB4 component
MYVAQQLRDHRLSDIAEYFGLQHYGGVSRAISDISRLLRDEKHLGKQLKDIIKRLQHNWLFDNSTQTFSMKSTTLFQ